MRFSRSEASVGVVLLEGILCLLLFPASTGAFSIQSHFAVSKGRRSGFSVTTRSDVPVEPHRRFSSTSDEPDINGDQVMYPALTRDEIEKLMADVPVFAVTQEDGGGVVLLTEKGFDDPVAYFFFNPETASNAFKNLGAKNEAKWVVTRFSLGLIWFELLTASVEGENNTSRRSVLNGVEYRIVPDASELEGARMLLSQAAGGEEANIPPIFKTSFNEVPVFLDPRLRIEAPDETGTPVEQFPIYLALQDLVMTCQQYSGEDQYDAMISVADLHDLVQQMQSESVVNFRQTTLFQPSHQPPPQQPTVSGTDNQESNSSEPESYKPSTNLDWSD